MTLPAPLHVLKTKTSQAPDSTAKTVLLALISHIQQLDPYLQHDVSCQARRPRAHSTCTCGLDDLRRQAAGAAPKPITPPRSNQSAC